MLTTIKLYLRKILHFLFKTKDEILFILEQKNLNDVKTLKNIWKILNLYKKQGLIIDEVEEEKTFIAWSVQTIKPNSSKNLVLNQQSSRSCVIYAMTRTLMYNSNIVLTKDEIEAIKEYAGEKGYWIDKKGMTFINWCRAIKQWLKINKNIDVTYVREKIGTSLYNQYVNELWYMASIWWFITDKFITDFITDGIINENYTWLEKKKYGHCWSVYNNEKNEVDNYVKDFWIYNQRSNNKQQKFISNGYYYPYAYFLFSDYDVKLKKEDEYRRIAGKSVINDSSKFWKKFWIENADEFIAFLEIIVDRKLKNK